MGYVLTYEEAQVMPSWLTKKVLWIYCEKSGMQVSSKANKSDLFEAIGQRIDVEKGKGVRRDAYVIDFGPAMGRGSAKGAEAVTSKVEKEAPMSTNIEETSSDLPVQKECSLSTSDLQTVLTTVLAQLNTFLEQALVKQQNAFAEQVVHLTKLTGTFLDALRLAQGLASARGAAAVASPCSVHLEGLNFASEAIASSSAVHLPVLKMISFSGNVEEVDPFEWLQAFEEFASKQNWDATKKLNSLHLHLTDAALDKWCELTSGGKVSWENAQVAWLEKLLSEKRSFFREQLSALRQGHGSVAVYTSEFLRLAKCESFSAKSQEVADDDWLLCARYIDGLNLHIEKEVRKGEHLTLSSAREAAEKAEALCASNSQSSGLCLGNTADLDIGQNGHLGSLVDGAAHMGDGRKRRQVTCFKCGGTGHMRRQCPSRGQSDSSQKGSQWSKLVKKENFKKGANCKSSRKAVQSKAASDSGQGSGQSQDNGFPAVGGSSDSWKCSTAAGPSSSFVEARESTCGGSGKTAWKAGRIPYLRGKVNGQDVSMMIDSGAYCSLLSRRVAQKLVPWRSIRPTSARPIAANGALLQLDGEVIVDLCIGTILVKHKFLVVARSSFDAVLGMDFLDDENGSRFMYCLDTSRIQNLVGVLKDDEFVGGYHHYLWGFEILARFS